MARVCKITGKRPFVGGSISRSGKAKKDGGIGRHVTKVNKRIFAPNLQRVKIIDENGTVKKGLLTKAPKRNWKPSQA